MGFARANSLTDDEWDEWYGRNVTVEDGSVAIAADPVRDYVAPEPAITPVPAEPAGLDDALDLADASELDIVDVDHDDCHVLYLLTRAGELYEYDGHHGRLRRLPCTWHRDGAGEPSALCVTEQSIFVTDAGRGRVHAFSRRLQQTRWIATGTVASPVAMEAVGDTALVLDEGGRAAATAEPETTPAGEPHDDGPHSDGSHGDGQPEPHDPHRGGPGDELPADDAPAEGFLATIEGGRIRPVVEGLADPVDLAVDGDEVLVLASGEDGAALRRFDADYDEVEAVALPADLDPTCIEVGSAGEVLVGVDPGEAGGRTLYRYLPWSETFEAVPRLRLPVDRLLFAPVRAWGGDPGLFVLAPGDGSGDESDDGATAASSTGAAADDDRDQLTAFRTVERRLLNGETDRYDGRVFRRFDAGEYGTQWHRVTLDFDLGGAGTQVAVRYLATEDDDLGYHGDPPPLEAIDGIGDTYAGRLRKSGVGDLRDLVDLDPVRVADLASTDEVEAMVDEASDWLDEADALAGEESPLPVEAVDGIGPTFAGRLAEAGVAEVGELLPLDPSRLADIVGTDELTVTSDRAAEWLAAAADLTGEDSTLPVEWIDGIGRTFADRLAAADVTDLGGLMAHDAVDLAEIVATGEFDVTPTEAGDWLDEAAALLASRRNVREVEWQRLEAPNPTDALLDDAVGRYLWVEIELVGDDHSSPRVDGFEVSFPRQSYLRHMPGIYRENEESAAFLERFLSIFESVFADVETEIEAASRYLHPDGVPAEYLDWLESWLALETGEHWPEAARREFVDEAAALFARRGTRAGLLAILGIYLDHADTAPPDSRRVPDRSFGLDASDQLYPPAGEDAGSDGGSAARGADEFGATGARSASVADCEIPEGLRTAEGEQLAYVFEHADLDCIDDPAVRAAYERLVPCPQCFLVLARSFLDDEVVETVDRIVDSEQPAHAAGRTSRLQPWAELGQAAFLGINSELPEREFVLAEAGLGRDAVLREREEDGQLGLRARIGTDTIIS